MAFIAWMILLYLGVSHVVRKVAAHPDRTAAFGSFVYKLMKR